MKKKLLLVSLMIALFALLAIGVSASTIYKDSDGNTLFSFEYDENNIISTYSGEFPKTDDQGNALTWYITATTTEGENTVKTAVSFKTLDEAYMTLDSNGKYTYKGNTGVTNRNIVSVYFPSDMGIKKLNLADAGYRNGYTYNPFGSEILFVYLPNTLTELPERIIQATKALVCDIPLDTPITKISHVAFHNSKSLREINIPSTVTEIAGKSANDGAAFYMCESLERVNFGENSQLTKIGEYVFHKNYKLKYVKIPDSVTYIGSHAFSYTSIEESPFGMGSRCEELGGRAFSDNSALKTFIVPATLKKASILGSQDYGPLADCLNIELVIFGNSAPITELLPSFFGRAGIEKIILPEGPTKIPNRYFTCATLGDVCFSDTIETADERVFQAAYVEVIRFGANFKHFSNTLDDNHSFTNATKGIKEIYLPASFYAQAPETVYHIGYAFTLDGTGTSNIKFFFTGSEEELATSLDNFKNGTKASGTNNWKFTGAEIVGYEEYLGNEDAYANKNVIIWGYDPCKAFCVPFYDESVVIETTIVYDSYLEKGTKTTVCPICSALAEGEEVEALFVCQGYSVPENGRGGISVCYVINNRAILEYTSATGKTMSFGVFAASQLKLGNGEAVLTDGTLADGVLGKKIDGEGIGAFEIKITGFTTDEQKNAKIVLGAYALVSKDETVTVSYMTPSAPSENEKYGYISFNDIVK